MDELLLTAPCLAACAPSPLSQGKMATESEQRPDSGDPPSEERAPNSGQKPDVDMDNLSKPELLTLLSILEGELEARDLVIETLRSRRKDVFIQERYGRFNLGDPFLALQRDYEAGGGDGSKDKQPICASPLSILEMVMSHCKKMQERMSAQLAAAEIRHRKVILDLEEERHKHAQDAAQGDDVTYMLEKERDRLLQQVEFEKSQLKQLETENKKMSTQFEEERMKNKQLVMMLVKECKQLAGRVVDESQALAEITKTLEDVQKKSSELEEELMNEKKKCVLMEAKMEKQLSEFDIEREQLRAKLNREENRTKDLRLEVENLKKMIELNKSETGSLSSSLSRDFDVGLSKQNMLTVASQTEPFVDIPNESNTKKPALALPAKPSAGNSLTVGGTKSSMSSNTPLVKAVGDKLLAIISSEDNPTQTKVVPSSLENGPSVSSSPGPLVSGASLSLSSTIVPSPPSSVSTSPCPSPGSPMQSLSSPSSCTTMQSGLSPRIQAARFKFQAQAGDQEKHGSPAMGPMSRDLSPTNRDNSPAKQLARNTVSQVLSRFTGPPSVVKPPCTNSTSPFGTENRNLTVSNLKPGLAHSATGRSPSLIPSLMPSGPVPLGGRSTLLHQAAAQGNVTLLSMLLNEDGIDINHLDEEGSSALYSAAKSGYTDFVTLLLNSGAQVDAVGKNLYTPLCAAAAEGHVGCTEVLIANGANVNYAAKEDETPLYLSCKNGHHECTLILLKAGVDYNTKTINGWTAFHAAANSGHVDCLRLLVCPRVSGDGRFADESEHKSSSTEPECPEGSDKFRVENMVSADLINQVDKEGWTAAHIAASKGFKNCLEVFCRHSGLDPNRKDKYQRTVHDVATDDCKHLLENWSAHKVLLQISMKHSEQISSSTEHVEKNIAVGSLIIHIQTTWDDLSRTVAVTLKNHYKAVMHGWELPETSNLVYSTEYDFISSGISAIAIGDEIWMPGQILTASPWSLIKWSQDNFVTVFLNVLQEGFLDSIAYASLIPVCILQNYLRLVEQYRNVIFHGPVGSCQDHVAHQVANCIKHKQEAIGSICEIIQIEMETSLSKDQLVELFIQRGILVPLKQSFVTEKVTVVLMKNLETAASLSEFLGELLDALENRGAENAFTFQHVNGNSDTYYFKEDGFLIGTMTKTKLQSSDLMVQQHFRWVQLRWDVEPISGLLQRFLKRQVIHKFQGQLPAPSDPVRKAVQWVCTVWYQLNSYLSRLGTPEALIGPRDFFSCPIMPGQVQPIMSWMANLWNNVIAPGVEEAILSRASVKKSRQRQPVRKSLNQGQQAVVKAALSILLNKAVLHGCSLSKQEFEECASEFQGWHFPLTMISSYKTSKKKIDNDAWRKVSTTPHKKSAHSMSQSWNKLKGNREGIQLVSELPKNFNELNTATKLHSLENNPLRTSDLEQGLSLYTDEDEDLISELQSLCLSKSESDISKIDTSKDLFFMIPGSQRDQSSLRTLKDPTARLPATKVSDYTLRNGTPTSSNDVKRVSRLGLSRVKSHLPVLLNNAHRIHHSSSNTRHLESNNNTSMEIWKLGKTVHDANNNK
ncbi:cortactin-binding protein 2 isoform X3 [Hypanus sabinus]|uniref:cortactin-binding protein 2 isoform X3 n=1 Tax=Hypanus sabinus TaxID=79690 RepID=UPI0028C4F3A6|nr:cortactin-binding protein 2 isoform X3 [Hypanus sabinus]